jgi:polysaccharide export outer membrane protein
VVFRTIKGQRMAAAFDLSAIRRAEAEDPMIYGNDIVVVDGSRGRALFRDIMTVFPLLAIFRPF